MTFEQRAPSMGLLIPQEGIYEYSDSISRVQYRQLRSTLGDDVPLLGVYTSKTTGMPFNYISYVSDSYQFIGNEALNNSVRSSIAEIRTPIFDEKIQLNYNWTMMYKEMIIRHALNSRIAGDIYPNVITINSYDGSRAANLSFGIFINSRNNNPNLSFGFRNKLGRLRQVHFQHARTRISTAVGGYMEAFSRGIVQLVEDNFNRRLNEDDMLKVLDAIESGTGKNRRTSISTFLAEQARDTTSAWDLFHAICRFSTIEGNLNIRIIMENIAESVLVIPTQMMTVVDQVNQARQ